MKKISLNRCVELLASPSPLSPAQVEALRDQLYLAARITVDEYRKQHSAVQGMREWHLISPGCLELLRIGISPQHLTFSPLRHPKVRQAFDRNFSERLHERMPDIHLKFQNLFSGKFEHTTVLPG